MEKEKSFHDVFENGKQWEIDIFLGIYKNEKPTLHQFYQFYNEE